MSNLDVAISKLKKLVGQAPHDYIPSTQFFLELNIQKIADDLALNRKGVEKGSDNIPASESGTFDAVEQEIIGYCQTEYQRNFDAYTNAMQTFHERLAALNIFGFLNDIRTYAREALSSFKAEVHQGKDELYARRCALLERERDVYEFRICEGISRAAHYPESHVFHAGVISLLLLLEGILNGSMLATGHEFGIIGGVLQAIIIAFINIAIGFAVGRFLLTQLFHKSAYRKVISMAAIAVSLVFIFFFNLAVAHYRDSLGDSLQNLQLNPGVNALSTLLADPWSISSIESWLLMLLGVVFSLIAAGDGFLWDDRYPGYGRLARIRDHARQVYVDGKDDLLRDLDDMREKSVSAMRDAQRDAKKRQTEYQAILGHMQSLNSQFALRGNSIERAGNQLLAIYHEANIATRSSPAPIRFNHPWKLEKRDPLRWDRETISSDKVIRTVTDAGKEMERSIGNVQDAYDEAVLQYRQIEDLTEKDIQKRERGVQNGKE